MGWFNTIENPKLKSQKKVTSNTPTGMWKKCVKCGEIVQTSKFEENNNVCPYCDHHLRLTAEERIELLIDKNSFETIGDDLASIDPLKFFDKKSYRDRLDEAKNRFGVDDGTIAGVGKIFGDLVAIGAMDFQYMGGSMGVVTGERISLVMDFAYEHKIPAIIVSSSGGARMQEGILSLMQMAKVSASRNRLKNGDIPFISILTDPTTGGVAASFAMVGDINIAEPGALIGFAGPRVIEQSIRQVLPEGFQRSEFLLEHGFLDIIVHRNKMKDELSFFIKMFSKK